MIAWFLGTRLGRGLLGFGAFLGAVAGTALVFFAKGKHRQADADKARDAQSLADAAQTAVATYQAADAAEQRVVQQTATQPAPDVAKRDDFDNAF